MVDIQWKTASGGRAAIRDASGSASATGPGHLHTLKMGEQKLYGFTFTLGYSRRIAVEEALDQKLGTRMRLHEAGQEQRSAARSSCTR